MSTFSQIPVPSDTSTSSASVFARSFDSKLRPLNIIQLALEFECLKVYFLCKFSWNFIKMLVSDGFEIRKKNCFLAADSFRSSVHKRSAGFVGSLACRAAHINSV